MINTLVSRVKDFGFNLMRAQEFTELTQLREENGKLQISSELWLGSLEHVLTTQLLG